MDALGERIIRDQAAAARLRSEADMYAREALRLRREATEIERLLELARQAQ